MVRTMCFLRGKLEERHVLRKTRQAAGMHLANPYSTPARAWISAKSEMSSSIRAILGPAGEAVARGCDSGGSYPRIKDALSCCSNNLQKEQRDCRFSGQGRAELWSREERPREETYFRVSPCSFSALFGLL